MCRNTMMGRKIISLILAMVMVLGLLPISESAAEEIEAGGATISVEDTVYYGTYPQSEIYDIANLTEGTDYVTVSNKHYKIEPIAWRVLENSDGELFLIAENNLDAKQYNTSDASVTWETSTARSWLNGYSANEQGDFADNPYSDSFIDTAFSTAEQEAINTTALKNPDNMSTSGGNDTEDRIFFLSIDEANSYFDNDTDRISLNTDYAKENGAFSHHGTGFWWLRTMSTYSSHNAAAVNLSGSVFGVTGVSSSDIAVRPALKINLESVILTSAAAGGKSGAVGSLSAAELTKGAVKLTVVDEDTNNLNLKNVALNTTTAGQGETVTVTYKGAKTGTHKYVSCVLTDTNGAVLYYGKLEDVATACTGSAKLTIPSDLEDGEYTVKVFNEECNGDNYTDFCSEPQEITFKVDSRRIIAGDTVYYGTYPQSEITDTEGLAEGTDYVTVWGKYYKIEPIAWQVLENSDGELFLIAEDNLDVKQYNTSYASVTWETSTVRSWLNGYSANEQGDSIDNPYSDSFIDNAFSTAEQEAINTTSLENPDNGNVSGGNATDDKIFFLSIGEANSYFTENNDRIAVNSGYAASYYGAGSSGGSTDCWWLGSPGKDKVCAVQVSQEGKVNYSGDFVNQASAVRPALKINLESVILTSAAKDGKSGAVGGLSAAEPTTGAVKLTVVDDSNLNLDNVTLSATTTGYDSEITVSYANAVTGANKYLSCIIEDKSGDVLYYGKLEDLTGSSTGSATLTIPSDLAVGEYTLKVFNEESNGDYYTDYASSPIAIPLKVSYTVTYDAGKNGSTTDNQKEYLDYGENPTSVPTITADTGYVFIGWKCSETGGIYDETAVKAYTVTDDVTFTAQYADSEKATVIFDYNGGTVNGVTSSYVSGKPGTTYTTPTPTKMGYTFDVWDSDSAVAIETFGDAGSVTTYTAKWSADSYTVKYNAGSNGSTSDDLSENVFHGENPTNVPTITADTGYVFIGWSNGSAIYSDAGVRAYTVTGDVEFTAQYADSLTIYEGNTKISGELTKRYGDDSFTLTAKGVGKGDVSWESNNENVATVDKNDGEVTITGVGTTIITATKENDNNKEIAIITLTVEKGILTITAKDKTVIYGQEIDNLEYGITGFAYGDDDDVLDSSITIETEATKGSNAGQYGIEVSGGAEAKNYDISFVGGKLIIEQAQPTVSLKAVSGAVFGEKVQVTAEVTGVAGGTVPTGAVSFTVDGEVTYGPYNLADGTCTAELPMDGGEHSISAVYSGNSNYLSAKSDIGSYTVEKANQSALQIMYNNTIVSEVSVSYGDSLSLGVIGGNGIGAVTWSSSNESIATVDSDGNVTILTAGSVAITATKVADSDYNEASVSVTLNISRVEQEELNIISDDAQIISSTIEVQYDSDSFTLGTSGGSGNVEVTWSSSNESVATVDENGNVTIIGSGTAIITATKQGDNIYESTSASVSLRVSSKKHSSYISGYTKDTFGPDNSLTRAEAAQLLYNIYVSENGEPEIVTDKSYSDVASADWYYKAVMYLSEKGVISGYPDGSFKPDEKITRAELVKMTVVFAGLSMSNTESSFSDVENGHWATYYISTAQEKGILSGYDDGTFKPNNNITRAETVKVLNSMQGRTASESALEGLTMPFSDVDKSHWAYYEILEASVEHEAH